jgi:hypothetical protein
MPTAPQVTGKPSRWRRTGSSGRLEGCEPQRQHEQHEQHEHEQEQVKARKIERDTGLSL